jgi:1,2-diacylglycerol 3-alpha-glucosyltransferase
MNILMMTNTYLPFVGGVERSVEIFTNEYRNMGHRVIIVAPRYENMPSEEHDVIRVPALQHFNGTDFSVQLPIPGLLNTALRDFKPDIVHSHHPFMLGDSALRVAAQFKVPIVFTFHTYYEYYTHYVPGNSSALKRFVVSLATGYANLCDAVFAPSNAVAAELVRRGVSSRIDVVPTGIPIDTFSKGDGRVFRDRAGIPRNAFVAGFVSRIAAEKNMDFIIAALRKHLEQDVSAHFLVIGNGPLESHVAGAFGDTAFAHRFHLMGTLTGPELIDAYHAMDVFVFASQTETQGLVLTEAMAAGVPVIALSGPVINELVTDFSNGRVLAFERPDEFAAALRWYRELGRGKRKAIRTNAMKSALPYSKEACSLRAVRIYSRLFRISPRNSYENIPDSAWSKAVRVIRMELELLRNMTRATGAAMGSA